jgi:hypothetical protein
MFQRCLVQILAGTQTILTVIVFDLPNSFKVNAGTANNHFFSILFNPSVRIILKFRLIACKLGAWGSVVAKALRY